MIAIFGLHNREDYSNYHYVNYICTRIMEFLQFWI